MTQKKFSSFLFILSGLTSAALALPTTQAEHTYYSDQTYSREVGSEVRPSCQGNASRLVGRRTRFQVITREACHLSRTLSIRCLLDGHQTVCPPNICDSPLVDCH